MSKAWPVEGIAPEESLAKNARRILAVRIAEFYSYAPIVAQESAIEELHALRIAAKRLRYTLELFRDVFGEVGERQIERVKAMQEALGEVHDHDVRLDLIAEELERLGEDGASDGAGPRVGLLGLRARQVAGRRAHYLAVRELWDRAMAEGMRQDLAALSAQVG